MPNHSLRDQPAKIIVVGQVEVTQPSRRGTTFKDNCRQHSKIVDAKHLCNKAFHNDNCCSEQRAF